MKVTFLGTNGWYNTFTGDTVCILVEGGGQTVVLDAGSGLTKLDDWMDASSPVSLLLSHFHLDHISGLHVLGKFWIPDGLRIFTSVGGRKILSDLLAQPFTIPLSDLPYPVAVHELPDEQDQVPFELECLEMVHTSRTLGFRLKLDDKILAYCPDTGYCAHAVQLAREADLLIAECAHRPGESNPDWPHLNPELAARIALEAGAKQLALVHFDARRYPSFAARDEAATAARQIFPHVIASRDGMQLEIE